MSFSPNKNDCRECRVVKVCTAYAEPDIQFKKWKKSNNKLLNVFYSGVDPCAKCRVFSCTYCIIKFFKLKFISVGTKDIIKEIEEFENKLKEELKIAWEKGLNENQ